MTDIHVSGITGNYVDLETIDLVERSKVLVCSEDIHSLLRTRGCRIEDLEWIPISPVKLSLERIGDTIKRGPVTVLTSGDPLFYGMGRLLKRTFKQARIRFQPAVSSMQICFARFALPWDDARFVSLHGRPLERFDARKDFTKLFLFTDPENSPRRVANYLLEQRGAAGCDAIVCHVGERLATSGELLYTGSVQEVAEMNFGEPNCMILVREPSGEPVTEPGYRLGLTEEMIHHSRGLITKNEVRAALLHALELPDSGVLWDVGSGSGSISIESARLYPGLKIYSVEKHETEVVNIERNRAAYHCTNVTVVHGEAPGKTRGVATARSGIHRWQWREPC